MPYRTRARQIVNDCLRLAGLAKTHRCTQIRIRQDLRLDGNRVYGKIHYHIGHGTFLLYLHAGMSDELLRKTIGHEIAHILTTEIINGEGSRRKVWEERACDLIGDLLARSIETKENT